MNSRQTADYSPTKKGSREENEAIRARKEMLGWFAAAAKPEAPKRKTWEQRMMQRARNFKPGNADGYKYRTAA